MTAATLIRHPGRAFVRPVRVYREDTGAGGIVYRVGCVDVETFRPRAIPISLRQESELEC